ncbi:MAG: globin domain-containing protein [Candidatus Kariarchaeaceae archaeon]
MTELDHSLIHDMIGGRDKFFEIVDNFYEQVKTDDLLFPMYPEDLEMAKKKLAFFLMQKFGGPDEYRPLRGQPMMRKRHFEFPIGVDERNRWVAIMTKALDESGIDDSHPARYTLQKYIEMMATHMINRSEFDTKNH